MNFDFKKLINNYNEALSYINPHIVKYWQSLENTGQFHQLGSYSTADRITFIINFGDQLNVIKILGFLRDDGLQGFYEDNRYYSESEFLRILNLKSFW